MPLMEMWYLPWLPAVNDAKTLGIICWFKMYDRYAREKGFRDQALGPACLTVIDPHLPETHPDLIKVFWCPFEGADYLAWKRSRKAA